MVARWDKFRSAGPSLGPLVVLVGLIAGVALQWPATHDRPALLLAPKVSVRVPDIDSALAWYEDKLGFQRLAMVVRAETTTRALLARDGNLIELSGDVGQSKPTAAGKATTPPPPIRIVVFDLDRRLAELRASGVEVVQDPKFVPKRDAFVAVVRDLNGRLVELQQALQI